MLIAFQLLLGFFIIYIQFINSGINILNYFRVKLLHLNLVIIGTLTSMCIQVILFFFIGKLISVNIYYIGYLFTLIGLLNLKKNFKIIINSLRQYSTKQIIFSLICAISLASPLLFSGLIIDGNFFIQDGQMHDSFWHIALIKNLQESIPPLHPSSFMFELTNYHYYYDLLIAFIAFAFRIDHFLLYFQIFTIFISLLFSFSCLTLAKKLKLNSYILQFLVFFAGNLGYLLPILINQPWSESSFWVSQTFVMMTNPQLILSFIIMLNVICLITKSNISHLSTKKNLLIILFILASLGIKTYSFIIIGFIYASYLSLLLLKTKKKKYLIWLSILFVTAVINLYFVIGFDSSNFFWHPLWFLDTLVEAHDRLNLPQIAILEQHYLAHGNYLRVFLIKSIEFFIFLVGNFGIRIVGLLTIPYFLYKKNKKFNELLLSIFISFLFCIIFPMLFLQKGTVWNSIQFYYYALILMNIFAAIKLTQFTKKLNKNKTISLIFILFCLSIPAYLKTIPSKLFKFDNVSKYKIDFFNNHFKQNDKILICPSDDHLYYYNYIGALSNAQPYLVDPMQLIIVGKKSSLIENSINQLLENQKDDKFNHFIIKNNITYFICQKNKLPIWLKTDDNMLHLENFSIKAY